MRVLLSVLASLLLFTTTAHASDRSIPKQSNPDQPILVDQDLATVPIQLAVGFGTSVPGEFNTPGFVDKKGPSRNDGGEKITVIFRQPKLLSLVRLAAYSKAKNGKVLVRKASARVVDSAGVKTDIFLTDLYTFDPAKHAADYNYGGLVIIPAGGGVSTPANQTISRLEFEVEGFTNNDATLLVQLVSGDGFAYEDFIIRRSGTSDSGPIGGYYDESNYADFQYADRKGLMVNGRNPTIAQLDNTTWVCSSYNYRGTKEIDYKTRRFFSLKAGLLQSTSDLSPETSTWILTQYGWRLPLADLSTTCGTVPLGLILRATRGGGHILEQVMERAVFRRKCKARGYSDVAIDNYFRDQTFNSAVNATRYAGLSHEYCRPADI